MSIQQGECDDGQIARDAQQVGEKQEDQQHNFQLWVISQTCQDKHYGLGVVSHYCPRLFQV